jgi:hypothetical protein
MEKKEVQSEEAWEAQDPDYDPGTTQVLPAFHSDKIYRVKTGLKLAFNTLPETPRVASGDIYSIHEIRTKLLEYITINRSRLRVEGDPNLFNFTNDPIGTELAHKTVCRCQTGVLIKLLLIQPPL